MTSLRLRNLLFWFHFATGLLCGAIIGIMAFTGVAISFEKQLIVWAERDVARVSAAANGTQPLSLDDVLKAARAFRPDSRPSSVIVQRDPRAAIVVTYGRGDTAYINPYSGEVHAGTAPRLRAFFHTMTEWHRWLGTGTEQRNWGRNATGISNIAFLLLAITGLILWWPKSYSWRALRPSVWFVRNASGKARDWNWHNAIGFWCAPILIVLTATGTVISYRWASDLVYRVTGSPVPATGPTAPQVEMPEPAPGQSPLSQGALLVAAQQAIPSWQQITFRSAQRPGGAERGRESAPRASRPSAVTVAVREHDAWPTFTPIQLTLNPFTGEVLRRESYSEYNLGRKVRSWMRFLHTGEALGLPGQAIAGLASLGGVFLVYTGFALAVRRAWPRRATLKLDPKKQPPTTR